MQDLELELKYGKYAKIDWSGDVYQQVKDTIKTPKEANESLEKLPSIRRGIRRLLEKQQGHSPSTEECLSKYLQALQSCFDSGASPTDELVCEAACLTDPDLLKILLENGGNPNATIKKELLYNGEVLPILRTKTALECAISPDRTTDQNKTIILLLEAGASIDYFIECATKHNPNFFESSNFWGYYTPGLSAETFYALGKAGFDINKPHIYGDSILMRVAAFGKDPQQIKALLDIGADPLYKSPNEETALQCAGKHLQQDPDNNNIKEIISLLEKAEKEALAKRNAPVPPKGIAKNTTPTRVNGNSNNGQGN